MAFEWLYIPNGLTAVLFCSIIFLFVPYLYITSRRGQYPPGPLALPIIGNLLQIALCGSMDVFCEKYRKVFGNVFTMETGGTKRVVISGYENFREVLIRHAGVTSVRGAQGRSDDARQRAKDKPGLFYAPYPNWKTLRTVSLHSLRDDGMGQAAMEPQISDEIDQYIKFFIVPNHGRPIDMTVSLPQATANIISQLIFNKRNEYSDAQFHKLVWAINESAKLVVKLGLTANIPFNGILFKYMHKLSHIVNEGTIIPALEAMVNRNRISLDDENPQGVIDHYLLHSKTKEGKDDFCFTDANSGWFAFHLYGAGTETTSTALKFCLLFMCKYPDVQERVYGEIEKQIGNKQVVYKDRLSLPYTEAVLLESLRIGNLVPNALPHMVEEDMILEGQVIPRGTDLLLNMASVLHDETIFEDPQEFKPQRYLEGDIALKKQRTIPFGIGRRNCLGESLAKVEFFMFFVSFMQRYSVTLPRGSKADPSDTVSDVIRCPKPYEIIFQQRVQ